MTAPPDMGISGRCANCKFWQSGEDDYNEAIKAKRCTYAIHIPDAQEWDVDCNNVLKPEFKDTKAFVNDGSGYMANFYTKVDFGCVQYEEKSDG